MALSVLLPLLPAHLGGLADGRLYWWVPASDAALTHYSPGRLLLEDLLQASHARLHAEFDVHIGDDAYTFHSATHSRVIGPVGVPPLGEQLRHEAHRWAKRWLAASPRVTTWLQRLRRRR